MTYMGNIRVKLGHGLLDVDAGQVGIYIVHVDMERTTGRSGHQICWHGCQTCRY